METAPLKRYFFFFLVTVLVLPAVRVNAQKYLVFDVIPKTKRYRYHIGESITFKLEKKSPLVTGTITELTENYLVLDNLDNIPLAEIQYFKVKRKGPWSGVRDVTGYVVPVLGVGYLGLETIDNYNTGREPKFREVTVTAAILSVAYGIYMQTLKEKVYKVNENHRLYTLDMDSGVQGGLLD